MKKLFAILAIATTAAPAAKMCLRHIYSVNGYKYAYNNQNGAFVLAAGNCRGTASSQCGGYPQSATYAGVGAPTGYDCDNIFAAGISACVGTGNEPTQDAATGDICMCKMTWPKESNWIYAATQPWSTGYPDYCRQNCASLCGCHMYNSAAPNAFTSAMFSGI
ncbi:MAG: hypothetical protein LBL46_02200 [Rickettsiales bacterium]|jgi:hypothetical protein|nr:hypothetical protein [Rickettsiales bacterium]